MSIWYEIKDEDSVSLSEDGKTIEILYNNDNQGNYYVDVPIEFIAPLLTDKTTDIVKALQELRDKYIEDGNFLKPETGYSIYLTMANDLNQLIEKLGEVVG